MLCDSIVNFPLINSASDLPLGLLSPCDLQGLRRLMSIPSDSSSFKTLLGSNLSHTVECLVVATIACDEYCREYAQSE